MKVLQAGLSTIAPVTVYDKTKPYMAGRVYQKSIGGLNCYGPPMSGIVNTFVDSAITPFSSFTTPNGRLFEITAVSAGLITVKLTTFDLTGQTAPQYIGKIIITLPNVAATTHTIKGFKAWDGATAGVTTGWQIMVATTGSVLINGGLFIAQNIAQSDFSTTSIPTIGLAVANNAKAVYFHQDPTAIGSANNLTSVQGMSLDSTNRKLYFHNGLVAATTFSIFDTALTPNIISLVTAGASLIAGYAGTAPTAYFSTALATNAMVAGDQVVILAGAPANFTLSTAAAQTPYFVRDVQTVSSIVYYNLAATSGGAAIVPTSSTSGMQVARAFGQSSSFWTNVKTGVLSGFAGTFLLTNSENYCTPLTSLDPNIPTALNNQGCIFLATTTGFYLFKVSDITSGALTLPSLDTRNVTGTGVDFTAITPTYAAYSSFAGAIIYVSNTAQFYTKRWINNQILLAFGGLITTWYELAGTQLSTFALAAITSLDVRNGWIFACGSTNGQRVTLYMDLLSDEAFLYSFLTSPVIDTADAQSFNFIQTIEKLFDLTAPMSFSYKTAALSTDATFNDPTTGWTSISTSADLSSMSLNNFSQFRIDFGIASGQTNTPAQVNELEIAYTGKNEIADEWAGDEDNTTQGAGSPSYVAFALRKQVNGGVGAIPTRYLRGYDSAGNLLFQYNSVTNASLVSYSSNSGGTWTPLGTTPNVVGTRERWLISSPPGQLAYMSVRYS